MTERNGVRLGRRVQDADGRDLGKVTALYEWGFAVSKGLPVLFARDWVARWDELRGARDGSIVVARSERDLFELAEGEIPRAWRVPVPEGYPDAATPSEAQGVFEEIAAGAIATDLGEPEWAAGADAATERAFALEERDERRGAGGLGRPAAAREQSDQA